VAQLRATFSNLKCLEAGRGARHSDLRNQTAHLTIGTNVIDHVAFW